MLLAGRFICEVVRARELTLRANTDATAMQTRIENAVVPPGFDYVNPYLGKFVHQFPHIDRGVFVMMPFSTAASESIFAAVTVELEAHGLIPLRADKKAFCPVLWWNVVTYMLGCSYGVV